MESTAPILVTGATGFIGTWLVQSLVQRGHRVRALVRRVDQPPPPGLSADQNPLRHPAVELVRGDVTDRESVRMAMRGCSRVFHLAAYARNWARDPSLFYKVNVEAVRDLFDTAEQLGVRRIVWTSTIATFGSPPAGQVGCEAMPRDSIQYRTDYARSKAMAELEVVERAKRGLPVVIVNPTRVYGPGHLSEANSLSRLIDQYDRGLVPFLPNRGVNVGNYVYVGDVVDGHLLAMEHGRIGECYILGGENVSLRELFRTIDRVSGKRHFQIPLLKLMPLAFAYVQQKRAEWFGVYPRITPGWVRTYLADSPFGCEKAQRELGYHWTPLEEGIRITYEWIRCLRQGGSAIQEAYPPPPHFPGAKSATEPSCSIAREL